MRHHKCCGNALNALQRKPALTLEFSEATITAAREVLDFQDFQFDEPLCLRVAGILEQ